MILIFGGVYQGKLSYALDRFSLTENDVYKCSEEDITAPANKKIIYETEKWILALVKSGIDVDMTVRKFINNNQEAIVICNDISCGIVPVDPIQRKWREAVGRSLALVSNKSDEVIRLFCGIPARIKYSESE